MDLLTIAKYPFLSESSIYLKEHGPSLDELLGDIAYERVRILGKERVLEAHKRVGLEPLLKNIRGGTDGARLCFLGLPTSNLFAGGHNFHGKPMII